MGCRVAELRTPGCHDTVGYAVYQSTAMANFTPIFGDQLAAEIFATVLHDIRPNWDEASVEKLCTLVNAFLRGKLGEQPEEHDDYLDYLCDNERQADLVSQFRNYRAVATL